MDQRGEGWFFSPFPAPTLTPNQIWLGINVDLPSCNKTLTLQTRKKVTSYFCQSCLGVLYVFVLFCFVFFLAFARYCLHALSRWKKRTMMMRFHLIVHARQACSCGKTYQLRLLIISLRVPKSSYFQWKSCTGYRFKLWRTRMEIICQRHQYEIRVVQLNPRQPNGLSQWEGYSDCGRSRCWSSFVERGNIRKIYI